MGEDYGAWAEGLAWVAFCLSVALVMAYGGGR